MSPESLNRRLGSITTMWSVVRRAHAENAEEAKAAQEHLVTRYEGAVRRYLLGALKDREAVDDLFQEFALSLARGNFRKVDPQHGSFRGYVKRVLSHPIARHYKNEKREQDNRKKREQQLPPTAAPDPAEPSLDVSWREQLLTRCSALLAEADARGGSPFAVVLRLRRDHPDVRSAQLAELLSEQLQRPVTPPAARQLLHRAREKYADLLVEEVADTLSDTTGDQLAEELIELGLYEYCRAALERRVQGH
jgi:RNA polymerase sigma factor (sigma-70 family)